MTALLGVYFVILDSGVGLGVHRQSIFGLLVFHCLTGGRIRHTDWTLQLSSQRSPGDGHVRQSCRRVGDDINRCDDFLLRALLDQHFARRRCRRGDRFSRPIPN